MARGLGMGAAVVAMIMAAGCGLTGGDDEAAAPAPAASEAADTGPEFEPVTESPTRGPATTARKAPAKPSRPAKKPTTRAAEQTQPAF